VLVVVLEEVVTVDVVDVQAVHALPGPAEGVLVPTFQPPMVLEMYVPGSGPRR
jgi:hypothetical protein